MTIKCHRDLLSHSLNSLSVMNYNFICGHALRASHSVNRTRPHDGHKDFCSYEKYTVTFIVAFVQTKHLSSVIALCFIVFVVFYVVVHGRNITCFL